MIRIAKIINTRGLKGECKLNLYTDQPEVRFSKGNTLYLEEKTPLTVVKYSEYKGFGYVFFEEITSIEQAETLKNQTLYLPEDQLGDLEDEDEFYYSQLNGCTVYNQNHENIGQVVDILETGANLVLRVQEGDKTYLLPFVKAHVKAVDTENKTIEIEEMAGLR